jgi:hypothetical protein
MDLKFAATARPGTASADVGRRHKLARRIGQQIGSARQMVEGNPFEAGKDTAHMVFVSHFLGDGSRGFDDVR